MVKPCLSDNATDILLASDPVLKWIVYNKLHVGNTFLYCYMGDDVVYLQTPVWWPEPIPQDTSYFIAPSHPFKLRRRPSCYAHTTRAPAPPIPIILQWSWTPAIYTHRRRSRRQSNYGSAHDPLHHQRQRHAAGATLLSCQMQDLTCSLRCCS